VERQDSGREQRIGTAAEAVVWGERKKEPTGKMALRCIMRFGGRAKRSKKKR
jgi:hypothetical protein